VEERIMELLVAIVILAIIVGVFLALRSRGESSQGSLGQSPSGGSRSSSPSLRQPTLDDLRPGDAISFWDGSDEVVESVVVCREELGGRASTWRWVILAGGRVVEVAPDSNVLYSPGTVFHQGTAPFYALTSDPADGGALKTFEARVRDQSIAREPVSVTLLDQEWTVESTGTFLATPVGPSPRDDVWRDISENPADNVYFELRAPNGDVALGIWTSHILLLPGRPLEETDIQNLYPGPTEVS
jgi:hypothetical protein